MRRLPQARWDTTRRMKALTLWQPWASLVACGAKRWETRSWRTAYRGPLIIHASQRKPPTSSYRAGGPPPEIPSATVEEMIQALGVSDFGTLPQGCVVAVADLTACFRVCDGSISEAVRAKDEGDVHDLLARTYGLDVGRARREWLLGDWTVGRFVWKLDNVRRLTLPFPCIGARGLWTPSELVRSTIERHALIEPR